MFTEATTFRPRNGASAEAYWRVRQWCEVNGFTLSDVLNSVFIPLAYYLENFSVVDHDRNRATVHLNVGSVDILHVFNGKCYPLNSQRAKESFSLEQINDRIAHWQKQNKNNPQHYDLLLLSPKQDARPQPQPTTTT